MSQPDSDDKTVDLFREFPSVSAYEWKAAVEKDLKGAYSDKLVWKPYEDFKINPFYRKEDLKPLDYLTNTLPGEFPYVRGTKKINNDWEIGEDIYEADIERANRTACNGIRRGLTSLTFICEVGEDRIFGVPIQNQHDMSILLKDIPIEKTPVHFRCGEGAPAILALFINEAKKREIPPGALRGSVDADPIKYLELRGSFYGRRQDSMDELRATISYLSEHMPAFKGLKVHSHHFHDAGATAVQELAFVLASGVEYLDWLTSADLTVDQVARHTAFSFSVGSNYFMEIAKLRAARLLWAQIVNQFKPGEEASAAMTIEVRTSSWNKTVYDPYVNMLRGTVEAMAAAIGGCDLMTVPPFDAAYKPPDEFSRRVARNTQIILKGESYLDKVIDPAAGSYYIENLTDSLAREAWNLFRSVEDKGGIVEALKSGFVQEEIEKTGKKRDADTATGKNIFLGVNQYPNLEERMSDRIEEGNAISHLKKSGGVRFDKTDSISSLMSLFSEKKTSLGDVIPSRNSVEFRIMPLTPYRGARAFEELRLATEEYIRETGKRPTVFLLTIGGQARRKARASFSHNFFSSAGFRVIDNPGFASVEEGVNAALISEAQIVVICSSDKEYAELAPLVSGKLKQENPAVFVIVAGYPKEIVAELKRSGVDDFIYAGANRVELIKKYQKLLGINT